MRFIIHTKSQSTHIIFKSSHVNLYLSTVKNSSGLNYIRKMVISKSKIHYINIMLITMFKLTNPNKNLFPWMPCLICFYNVSLKVFWDYSEILLALHFEEDYSKAQHHQFYAKHVIFGLRKSPTIVCFFFWGKSIPNSILWFYAVSLW